MFEFRKKIIGPKESQIEIAIGHFLKFLNLCFYKQNVRGFFYKGRFRKDQNPYAVTGASDYVILYRGFYCAMEVKTKVGKQQKNQKQFESYIKTKGGADYCIVRSVDDARGCIDQFIKRVNRIYGVNGEGELPIRE